MAVGSLRRSRTCFLGPPIAGAFWKWPASCGAVGAPHETLAPFSASFVGAFVGYGAGGGRAFLVVVVWPLALLLLLVG